jgi:hypothetical protein
MWKIVALEYCTNISTVTPTDWLKSVLKPISSFRDGKEDKAVGHRTLILIESSR